MNFNNLGVTIFVTAIGIGTVLAHLLAIVVALQKWRTFPRPSKFLLLGLLITTFSFVGGYVVPMFVFRVMGPGNLGIVMIFINGARSSLHIVALGLMVAAVYVDRVPRAVRQKDEFLPGDEREASNSSNPFVPPK